MKSSTGGVGRQYERYYTAVMGFIVYIGIPVGLGKGNFFKALCHWPKK
jgi:hypothetical protein